MKSSIGRIVHYRETAAQTKPLAAIITAVNDDGTVKLTIFYDTHTTWNLNATEATDFESADAQQWFWPPRV